MVLTINTVLPTMQAAAVIGEIAAVEPAEYERQQNATGEKAGVRSIAAFVEEMANRLPRLMANQIALLLPHLGGKAWTLRSGIVTAVSYLLHKAFDSSSAPSTDADAQGAAARLRSKQSLLDILCARVRDQSSYTRKAVLQAWTYLAENHAVPLGHWQVVTSIAVGRLEDKSSLVRKEALRLLGCLMLHNPFGPALPVDRFEASLNVHKVMLDAVMPSNDGGIGGGCDDDMQAAVEVSVIEEEGEGTDGEIKEEEKMDVDDNVDAEGDANQEQAETQAEEQQQQQQQQQAAKTCQEVGWDGTVEELQALVASLELAVAFARSLAGCMPTLVQLLASSTVSDVQESIALLLTCKQFEVAGAPDAIRKMLPLVFARDQAVKDRIIEALDQLYITGWAGHTFTSAQAARNLVDLASGATLGELGSMEEVVQELMGKGFLTPVTLHELWEIAGRAGAAVAAGAQASARARRDLRASLAVLSMAAVCKPEAFGEQHVANLLKLGFAGGKAADAFTTRHACIALQNLSVNLKLGLYENVRTQMYAALTTTVVASPLPDSCWYSATEAALTALYNIHPAPEHIAGAIVRTMARNVFGGEANTNDTAIAGNNDDNNGREEVEGVDGHVQEAFVPSSLTSIPTQALSQFFFVVGHVALQHLVLIERSTKAVRRARLEAEKRAAEESAERAMNRNKRGAANASDDDKEDINAELGVGSVAADAELDAMKEACEAQILAAQSLLGPYAKLAAAMCRHRALLSVDPTLRASALLALSKLMVVDPRMCEENIQLMFTLLAARSVEPELRSNLTIALGDLALRFPNILEPWTEHMYRPLGDPDPSVRKNTLMVLSHLILNDMMKVKGHIAKMAVCLEDQDSRISSLAELFFHELAKKEYKGTSPIYNLLPDILSNLSKEANLGRAGFQSVMQQLLGYIKKDKQGDALVEKLCQRFAATEDVGQWRNVAFCLSQLPISEKGMRKLAECFKLYKNALGDAETAETICGVLAKGKKSATKPEVKTLLDELEAKIEGAAAERAEEEAAAAAAADRAAKDRAKAEAREQQQGEDEEGGDADMGAEDCSDEECSDDELIINNNPGAAAMVKKEDEVNEGESSDDVTEQVTDDEDEQPTVERPSRPSTRRASREEKKSGPPTKRATRGRRVVKEESESEDESEGSDDQEEEEEKAPVRRTSGRRGSAKAASAAGSKMTRSGRSTRTMVVDSDDDQEGGEDLIAAQFAGMKVEAEDDD